VARLLFVSPFKQFSHRRPLLLTCSPDSLFQLFFTSVSVSSATLHLHSFPFAAFPTGLRGSHARNQQLSSDPTDSLSPSASSSPTSSSLWSLERPRAPVFPPCPPPTEKHTPGSPLGAWPSSSMPLMLRISILRSSAVRSQRLPSRCRALSRRPVRVPSVLPGWPLHFLPSVCLSRAVRTKPFIVRAALLPFLFAGSSDAFCPGLIQLWFFLGPGPPRVIRLCIIFPPRCFSSLFFIFSRSPFHAFPPFFSLTFEAAPSVLLDCFSPFPPSLFSMSI